MSETPWPSAALGPAGLWPPGEREPLLSGDLTYGEITRAISAPLEGRPGAGWWIAFLVATSALVRCLDVGTASRHLHDGRSLP